MYGESEYLSKRLLLAYFGRINGENENSALQAVFVAGKIKFGRGMSESSTNIDWCDVPLECVLNDLEPHRSNFPLQFWVLVCLFP